MTQWHDRSLPLLVDVGHKSVVGVEQNLCVVLEIDLHNLVTQTEHDGVSRPHPLFHVDRACGRLKCLQVIVQLHLCVLVTRALLRRRRLQVALEVLQKGYLLLQFLWKLVELILRKHVLLLARADGLAFIVIEAATLVLRHYLGRVVEEDTCRVVRQ